MSASAHVRVHLLSALHQQSRIVSVSTPPLAGRSALGMPIRWVKLPDVSSWKAASRLLNTARYVAASHLYLPLQYHAMPSYQYDAEHINNNVS